MRSTTADFGAANPLIDVAQASALERPPHLVHVQPQHANCQFGALLGFQIFALPRRLGHLNCQDGRHDDDAIAVDPPRRAG